MTSFMDNPLSRVVSANIHCTEVGSAPLIHFQKLEIMCFIYWNWSENSNFILIIFGWLYLVEKEPKISLKKPQIGLKTDFPPNKFSLANLKCPNSYKMRKKSLVLLHKFWTYFFQIGEVEAPFSNLLSTAINNFIKQKVNFFSK